MNAIQQPTYRITIALDALRGNYKHLTFTGTAQSAQDYARRYVSDNHLSAQSIILSQEA